jgi:hypothetical protein
MTMQQLRSILPAITAAVLVPALGGRAMAQPGCSIPSDHHVVIAIEPLEMVPGERRVLELSMVRAPYTPSEPVPAACKARWSVNEGSHARVDDRGRFRLTRYARPGEQVVVSVNVGGRKVRQEVHVIDPHPNPIAGTWSQSGPAQCDSAVDAAAVPVRELVIRRDGRFSLTYTPFETYKDYWGTYTFDQATGALAMGVAGGTRDPWGLDLAGTAHVADRRLTLRGVWLGQPGQATARTCTYVFTQ